MGTCCCCCFYLLQDVLQDLPSLQQWDPCSSHKQAINDIIKSYMNKKSTPEHISGHLKIQRGICAGRGESWLDISRELMKGLMPGGCGKGWKCLLEQEMGSGFSVFPSAMMKHLHCISGDVSLWSTPSASLAAVPLWGVLLGVGSIGKCWWNLHIAVCSCKRAYKCSCTGILNM